jgi:hypothetical protein
VDVGHGIHGVHGIHRRATGRRRVLRSIGEAGYVLAVIGLAAWPLTVQKPNVRNIREELLRELRPIVLANCTMQRFGSANDGGYLMCGNLLGNVRSAYSYGIGSADDWGCEVSQRQEVPLHQYDCFDPGRPSCPGVHQVFHDECIGPTAATIDKRAFDSLTSQIRRNGDAGKTLVVKIDVEGAELTSLMATSDRVLERIDQLAMELHGVNEGYLDLVRKLKRTFFLVHLHYNNQACSNRYRPLPAWAYQVLFVNKRIGVRDPSRPVATLPHPLDAPDYAIGGDCQTPKAIE